MAANTDTNANGTKLKSNCNLGENPPYLYNLANRNANKSTIADCTYLRKPPPLAPPPPASAFNTAFNTYTDLESSKQIALEIKTKSIENTLLPLVNQVISEPK